MKITVRQLRQLIRETVIEESRKKRINEGLGDWIQGLFGKGKNQLSDKDLSRVSEVLGKMKNDEDVNVHSKKIGIKIPQNLAKIFSKYEKMKKNDVLWKLTVESIVKAINRHFRHLGKQSDFAQPNVENFKKLLGAIKENKVDSIRTFLEKYINENEAGGNPSQWLDIHPGFKEFTQADLDAKKARAKEEEEKQKNYKEKLKDYLPKYSEKELQDKERRNKKQQEEDQLERWRRQDAELNALARKNDKRPAYL